MGSPRDRAVQVRVRWTAPVALTVSLGDYYFGVSIQKTATNDEREIVLEVPSNYHVDRLLIGIASPSGTRQPIPGPVGLHIDATLP